MLSDPFIISIVSGLASGVLTAIASYFAISKKIHMEFERNAELELRARRVPIIQKLWKVMEPISYRSGRVKASERTISKFSEELTTWYYEVGGIYLSKSSWSMYIELQKALEKLQSCHGVNKLISELPHRDLHYLQHDGSALRSCTAKDCGTRSESSSDMQVI
jgi:hypothetical protein